MLLLMLALYSKPRCFISASTIAINLGKFNVERRTVLQALTYNDARLVENRTAFVFWYGLVVKTMTFWKLLVWVPGCLFGEFYSPDVTLSICDFE